MSMATSPDEEPIGVLRAGLSETPVERGVLLLTQRAHGRHVRARAAMQGADRKSPKVGIYR